MKYIPTLILVLVGTFVWAQGLPNNITLKDLQGKSVKLSDYNTKSNPVIVSFWATWCAPCVKELKAIHKQYPQWQNEFAAEFIAVATDDAKTKNRVKAQVKGAGWAYTVLMDDNHELKRAMNVTNVPYTVIIHNGKIAYVHSGYTPGIENQIYKELQTLTHK